MDTTGMSRGDLSRRVKTIEPETLLPVLMKTIAAAVFIFQGTKMRYVNAAALEITGYSEAELLGHDFWEILHPDFREMVKERGLKRQQGEEIPSNYEVKIITKSGEERWLAFSGNVFEFEGKPAVLGTAFDITGRKQMEERTKQAEERYRVLYENIPSMYFTVDPRGTVISVNKFGASELGYTPEELIGDPVLKVFPEKDHSTVLEQLNTCSHSPSQVHDWQIQKIRKDGSSLWVEEFARMVKGVDGKPNILVVCQDITERKKAEDALQEAKSNLERRVDERTSELINANIFLQQEVAERKRAEAALQESRERLETVMEKIPHGVAVVMASGELTYCNPAFVEMFGFTEEELKESNVIELVAPSDREKVVQKIRYLYNDGLEYPSEYKALNKEGRLIPIEVFSRRIIYDGNPGILSVVIDITERKRVEEELRNERDLAQKYLDIAGVLFVVVGADQKIHLINKRGCEILEYEESEILGKNWWNHFIPRRNRREVKAIFQQLMLGNTELVEYHENSVLTKSGEEKIIAWHNTVLTDEEGGIIGTLSSGEDITERKRAGEELMKHQIHLEELVEERTTRLKAINETLRKEIQERKKTEDELSQSREELRKLSLHLEFAREKERARIAREIHDELGQALSILQMDLAWIETNIAAEKEIVLKKITYMSEFIGKIMDEVQRISGELRPSVLDHLGLPAALSWQAQDFYKRTGIQCNLFIQSKDIQLDPDQSSGLFRVFQETLTNILRHANASKITVKLEQNNGQVQLVIKDNGVGIQKEKISGPNSFGLIGMRERVHMLNGKLKIKGVPNKGTSITVSIPLNKGGKTNEGSHRR